MSIFSDHHTTTKLIMLSLKVVSISTSLLLIAMLVKPFLPQLLLIITISFAQVSDLPSLLNVVASWLKPPYLYLVINCIIITLVATSKLQSKFDHYALSPPPPPLKQADYFKSDDDEVVVAAFDHFSFSPESSPVVTVEAPVLEYYGFVPEKVSEEENRVFESKEEVKVTNVTAVCDTENSKVLNSNKLIISRAPEFSKPPASVRFGHRKVKTSTHDQGGKTVVLKAVSKAKRHETLESTWKTITDGRPMPLTRHLIRKFDTWENHPASSSTNNAMDHTTTIMTKSDTFNDAKKKSSAGKVLLKKDPSLGQEELNKRVEAFITKFNEDMRLQRQESLNQYMEMINRGAAP